MNSPTDTRLTDYALDELSEAERREIEALLKADDDAAAEVEELRGLAQTLRAATVAASNGRVEQAADAPVASSALRSLVQSKLATSDATPAESAPTVELAPAHRSWLRRHWKAASVGLGGVTAASLALIFPLMQGEYKTGSGPLAFLSGARQADAPGATGGTDQTPLDGGLRYGSSPTIPASSSGSKRGIRALVSSSPRGERSYGAANSGAVDADEPYEITRKLDQRIQPSQTASPILRSNATAYPPGAVGEGISIADSIGAPKVDVGAVNVFTQSSSTFAASVPETPQITAGGTLTLSGSNTYTGVTVTGAGTIAATAAPQGGRRNPTAPQGVTKSGAGTLVIAESPVVTTSPEAGNVQLNQLYSYVTQPTTAPANGPTPVVGDFASRQSPVAATPRIMLESESSLGEAADGSRPQLAQTADERTRLFGRNQEVMLPLMTEHEELLAAHGPKHPKVAEIELKIKLAEERLETMRVSTAEKAAPEGTWERDVLLQLLREHDQALVRFGPNHPKVNEIALKIERIQKHLEQAQGHDTEAYDPITENSFLRSTDAPLSTFSIDVDTASYSNVRRMLTSGQRPPRGAVRLEEFLNYFSYDYPQPKGDEPFSVTTEAARCPWNAEHVLVRVGLKGKEIHRKERPASNLVFLVDVSGSMQDANKLPLVRESLKLLVRELGDSDRVSIVVYAGNTGLVLKPTGGNRKQEILDAIDVLDAGGSTNGGAGIQLAYQLAADNFIKEGVNRVVLATDGDFNVGVTSQDELVRLIEEKAKTGVFFTALGYGMGNLKDSTLEKLADKGNGNYAYIDTLAEAKKVLVEQMSGTLVTIAKDVKIQIEFNPQRVAAYRLLGYENRVLAAQDFNDDKKDAGEIGAGHTVTALYELVPVGAKGTKEAGKLPSVDPLKYQQPTAVEKPAPQSPQGGIADELLTLKLRYKQPDGDKSKLLEQPLKNDVSDYAKASKDFKFASAVAGFGMLLRRSQYKGTVTYDAVLELAQEGLGDDKHGYRKEFIELVRKAKEIVKGR